MIAFASPAARPHQKAVDIDPFLDSSSPDYDLGADLSLMLTCTDSRASSMSDIAFASPTARPHQKAVDPDPETEKDEFDEEVDGFTLLDSSSVCRVENLHTRGRRKGDRSGKLARTLGEDLGVMGIGPGTVTYGRGRIDYTPETIDAAPAHRSEYQRANRSAPGTLRANHRASRKASLGSLSLAGLLQLPLPRLGVRRTDRTPPTILEPEGSLPSLRDAVPHNASARSLSSGHVQPHPRLPRDSAEWDSDAETFDAETESLSRMSFASSHTHADPDPDLDTGDDNMVLFPHRLFSAGVEDKLFSAPFQGFLPSHSLWDTGDPGRTGTGTGIETWEHEGGKEQEGWSGEWNAPVHAVINGLRGLK